MAQYIQKDALVEEIRKRLLPVIRDKHYDEWEEGQDSERIAILGIIDTLEVKEVDLEKEIQDHIKECLDIKFPTTDIELIKKDVAYTAKKFFELGLKHRKEIETLKQPKFHVGDIIVCHSTRLRSLYRKKAIVVSVNEKDGYYHLRMTEGDETIGISFNMEGYFGLWESYLFRVRGPEVKDLLDLIKTIYRDFGRQDLINEAVNYLRDNKEIAVKTEDNGISGWITDEFIEKYKQYLLNKTKNVKL